MKKTVALILSILMIAASAPITAFAEEAPVLRLDAAYTDCAELSWTYGGESESTVIEHSVDKKVWTQVTEVFANDFTPDLTPKKANYFRVRSRYLDKSNTLVYSPYSNTVEVFPDTRGILEAYDVYVEANEKQVLAEWSVSSDDKSRIDGFTVYKSINGGAFKADGNVSVNSTSSAGNGLCYYRFTCPAPSGYGYFVKIAVCPYYTYNGKKHVYFDKGSAQSADYLDYDNFAKVTTKKKRIAIKLKALGGAPVYRIDYSFYNLKNSKTYKKNTVNVKSTSYTIKNNAAKYGCYINITPVWNGEEGGTVSIDSHQGMTLMEGAAKSKNKVIKTVGTRTKKTKIVGKHKLSKKEKRIIKRFFKKNFKKKNATRAEKARFAWEWIHKNVRYDYGFKHHSDRYSYVEAVFKKRYGQCIQYNGALAEVLTYLGYEARIIEGYRMDSKGKPTVHHYWCEVKVHGRWYLCETGNYGKNGEWRYFCSRYADSGGYTKNLKPAKD